MQCNDDDEMTDLEWREYVTIYLLGASAIGMWAMVIYLVFIHV